MRIKVGLMFLAMTVIGSNALAGKKHDFSSIKKEILHLVSDTNSCKNIEMELDSVNFNEIDAGTDLTKLKSFVSDLRSKKQGDTDTFNQYVSLLKIKNYLPITKEANQQATSNLSQSQVQKQVSQNQATSSQNQATPSQNQASQATPIQSRSRSSSSSSSSSSSQVQNQTSQSQKVTSDLSQVEIDQLYNKVKESAVTGASNLFNSIMMGHPEMGKGWRLQMLEHSTKELDEKVKILQTFVAASAKVDVYNQLIVNAKKPMECLSEQSEWVAEQTKNKKFANDDLKRATDNLDAMELALIPVLKGEKGEISNKASGLLASLETELSNFSKYQFTHDVSVVGKIFLKESFIQYCDTIQRVTDVFLNDTLPQLTTKIKNSAQAQVQPQVQPQVQVQGQPTQQVLPASKVLVKNSIDQNSNIK